MKKTPVRKPRQTKSQPEGDLLPEYRFDYSKVKRNRFALAKPNWRDFIQSDPAILQGKPVVAGTRITVELILDKLAAGESVEQILEAHPRLTRDTVLAAIAFAADALKADVIYPTAATA
jgi:uncharacterized protein (DUF433 family)